MKRLPKPIKHGKSMTKDAIKARRYRANKKQDKEVVAPMDKHKRLNDLKKEIEQLEKELNRVDKPTPIKHDDFSTKSSLTDSYMDQAKDRYARYMDKMILQHGNEPLGILNTKGAETGAAKPYGDGFNLKDSGERQTFDTGAVRDTQGGKGRFDLLPAYPLFRLANLYEAGAVKYAERNWEKGIPLARFFDSAFRHLMNYLDGDRSEDHITATCWNLFGFLWTEEQIRRGLLPKELANLTTPKVSKDVKR